MIRSTSSVLGLSAGIVTALAAAGPISVPSVVFLPDRDDGPPLPKTKAMIRRKAQHRARMMTRKRRKH